MPPAEISGTTRLAVLLGDPVAHSLSPAIHNAAFGALGLDAVYLASAVDAGRLAQALDGLAALGALGANVTIPHKRAALALADVVTDTARALGAANTLVPTAAGWRADNTDVAGFVAPLGRHARALRGERVVVLGAGGAARAVVYAGLAHLGMRVAVAARRPAQAEALAGDLAAVGPVDVIGLGDTAAIRDAALVVNATPLGMDDGKQPVGADALRDGQVVYDLVYRPAETPLLAAARSVGATAIGGLPMLIGQAAAAFHAWTGRDFPTAVARDAALSALR